MNGYRIISNNEKKIEGLSKNLYIETIFLSESQRYGPCRQIRGL